jgi:hypothetical protein
MHLAARAGIIFVLALAAGLSPAMPTLAQQEPACRILKSDGAGFVQRCGDRLYSYALVLDDISRSEGSDGHGRFGFVCPIELMCQDKPEILGWFIDPQTWRQGAQDEGAIANLVLKRSWNPPPSVPKSSCDTFEVTIGDMAGRAVCYLFAEIPLSVVLIAAADEKFGFVLVFQQHNPDWMNLREKALQALPRFRIQRASGDAALMRYMK